jgi:enoyl-CoA hydratase/carnithine racemase
MDELEALVAELAADDAVRAVMLTGAGDANFSVEPRQVGAEAAVRADPEGDVLVRIAAASASPRP